MNIPASHGEYSHKHGMLPGLKTVSVGGTGERERRGTAVSPKEVREE